MDIKSALILLLYTVFYIPPTYLLLKKFGVKDKLLTRSIYFGSSIMFLQFVLPIVLLFIGFNVGLPFLTALSFFAGLVLSYLYISKVLAVKPYQNILIVISLPIVSGLLSMPVFYVIHLLST